MTSMWVRHGLRCTPCAQQDSTNWPLLTASVHIVCRQLVEQEMKLARARAIRRETALTWVLDTVKVLYAGVLVVVERPSHSTHTHTLT